MLTRIGPPKDQTLKDKDKDQGLTYKDKDLPRLIFKD